ncbi:hypothetical protein EDB83DRAFT_74930 [Lactarius deliciosus]|nr:hypothetical protein EDB83DRAFT_74930 [Lactarius deliciosus]
MLGVSSVIATTALTAIDTEQQDGRNNRQSQSSGGTSYQFKVSCESLALHVLGRLQRRGPSCYYITPTPQGYHVVARFRLLCTTCFLTNWHISLSAVAASLRRWRANAPQRHRAVLTSIYCAPKCATPQIAQGLATTVLLCRCHGGSYKSLVGLLDGPNEPPVLVVIVGHRSSLIP